MPGQLQLAGAQPQKQPKYAALLIDKSFTGIYTQRNPLHDPSSVIESKFYGGRPDALWAGSNIELTNRLTLQRRPGLSQFSCTNYPTAPLTAFSFERDNGTIQVIVDTGSTGNLALFAVDMVSGVAYYHFASSQCVAANDAFLGYQFQVTGFDVGGNNGTFNCLGSTSSYLILQNANAVTDTASAIAISSGAVYYDEQNCASYNLSAIDEISGIAYYHFTTPQPAAANNGFEGQVFIITGFDDAVNNGTFACTGSTSTYMILDNPNAVTDTHAATASSSGKILLFGKSPNAGQTFFVAVAGILYMGDGVDTRKYVPDVTNLNPNAPIGTSGQVWDWGTAAPVSQPSVTITESGNAATQWVMNTVFSTMGLIVDPNQNIQQLYSVNGLGNNPPPATLGTSGNGAPAFNTNTGSTTTDGTVTWTSQGPITLWIANTTYAAGQAIYDPTTNCIFVQSHSAARQSGATKPAFNSTLGLSGARIDDTATSNNARWENLGVVNVSPTAVKTWTKNTVFNQYTPPSSGNDPSNVNSAVVYPLIPNLANLTAYAAGTGPAIYLLGATTAGTTANTNYNPWTGIPAPPAVGSQTAGAVTFDNQLEWLCLGPAAWVASTPYLAWTAQGATFGCIYDKTTSTFQVCTTGGQSGTSVPSFNAGYGAITQDNSVQWTCVGQEVPTTNPSGGWSVSTQWNLPIVGFAPPSPSQPYGGSEVIGSGYVQSVINSGLSGNSAPSWSTTIGNLTYDPNSSEITWKTVALYSQNFIAWTSGYVYAYSYEARLADDIYNTTAPPGLSKPLGVPTGSETGLISTASPVFTITGSNTGAVNTISGIGSTDPQIDTIVIWRSADGGGSANMFYLTEIPAPPPIAGVAQPWSFSDYLPDSATSLFPGLNELISAPIDDQNNPPPSDFLPMVYNFVRIWGGSGQEVVFTGGPDIEDGQGNPNECFNPVDEFPFLANVVNARKCSQGIIVFLTDSIEIIAGGPATTSFYNVTLSPGIGLTSPNALDGYAGELYFFSADSEFKIISPSLSLTNAGFPLGDKFAQFTASEVYVAVQQAGIDNAIFVTDGSTGWYRVNPHQVPGGYSGPEPVWSPFANIAGGAQMVVSVEVTPGIKKLLVGSTPATVIADCGAPILERNLNVFTDNGTMYDAYFVIGSVVLAAPGHLAVLKFLEMDFSIGATPQVSYLLNEISGAFTEFTLPGQYDPPSIYGVGTGPYGIPTSYLPLRYYFAGIGNLARCRHMQIMVDFGETATGDELIGMTIFGRLLVEL